MRKQSDPHAGALPPDFPGRPVVSLTELDGSACVTGYVNVANNAPGTVRLNLYAEMDGTLAHVASAFVPPGFAGIWVTVTGFVVDAWHTFAQALDPAQTIRTGLMCSECCAAPAVQVPTALQVAPPDVPEASPLWNPPPAPMQDATGRLRLRSLDNPGGADSVTLGPGERLIGLTLGAGGGAGSFVMRWPNGRAETFESRGLDGNAQFFEGIGAAGVTFDTFSGALQSFNAWTVS